MTNAKESLDYGRNRNADYSDETELQDEITALDAKVASGECTTQDLIGFISDWPDQHGLDRHVRENSARTLNGQVDLNNLESEEVRQCLDDMASVVRNAFHDLDGSTAQGYILPAVRIRLTEHFSDWPRETALDHQLQDPELEQNLVRSNVRELIWGLELQLNHSIVGIIDGTDRPENPDGPKTWEVLAQAREISRRLAEAEPDYYRRYLPTDEDVMNHWGYESNELEPQAPLHVERTDFTDGSYVQVEKYENLTVITSEPASDHFQNRYHDQDPYITTPGARNLNQDSVYNALTRFKYGDWGEDIDYQDALQNDETKRLGTGLLLGVYKDGPVTFWIHHSLQQQAPTVLLPEEY